MNTFLTYMQIFDFFLIDKCKCKFKSQNGKPVIMDEKIK